MDLFGQTKPLKREAPAKVLNGTSLDTTILPGLRNFRPHAMFADVIEDIWDWELSDLAVTSSLPTFKVMPSIHPRLTFHYRVPYTGVRSFGPRFLDFPARRHLAVKLHSGILTICPNAPVGNIIVRLKPEAAGRIFTGATQHLNEGVHLHDIFGGQAVALAEEALSEASDSLTRVRIIQEFVAQRALPPRPVSGAARAASLLRSNPSLKISRIAAKLEISERSLLRSFRSTFGTGPKRFAQLVRVGKAVEARRKGSQWADIALDLGLSDQSHLIHDFYAVTGITPEAIFRP